MSVIRSIEGSGTGGSSHASAPGPTPKLRDNAMTYGIAGNSAPPRKKSAPAVEPPQTPHKNMLDDFG